jgi:transposase
VAGAASTAERLATYDQLLALRAWLDAQSCPIDVLESTGVYWKPIYHVLVETLEIVVAHARSMRQRPGKKTDKADASWLAALLAHGLVEPSFIPPPAVQAWRDLTRTRVALVQTRTQVQNRLSKVWEDTNIKVAHAMSDLFGASGRRMLKALCAGERNPRKLAALALGILRRKLPELEVALTGGIPNAFFLPPPCGVSSAVEYRAPVSAMRRQDAGTT